MHGGSALYCADRMPPAWEERPTSVLNHCGNGFEFIGANKLIAFHCHCDFKLGGIRRGRLLASQNFAETPDSHRGIAARQRYQIFDAPADLDIRPRQETDTTRADVSGLLSTVDPQISQLNDLQRELQFVPLSTSLFQELYFIRILLPNQLAIVLPTLLRQS